MKYCLDRVMDERVPDFMCADGWPRFVEVAGGSAGLDFGTWAALYVGGIAAVCLINLFIKENQ